MGTTTTKNNIKTPIIGLIKSMTQDNIQKTTSTALYKNVRVFIVLLPCIDFRLSLKFFTSVLKVLSAVVAWHVCNAHVRWCTRKINRLIISQKLD